MIEELKKVSENLSAASDRMQDRNREIAATARNVANDLAVFGKDNVEALLESGRIAAAGTNSIARSAIADARQNAETVATALKTAMADRSVAGLFSLPTSYTCAGTDLMVSGTSKYMQSWLKLAGDAAQPLVGRVNAAAALAQRSAEA